MMNKFEGAIGQEYDLFKLAAPYHDRLQSALGRIVQQRMGKPTDILEIGSGTGLTTTELNQRFPKASITGVDSELVMVKQAKQKVVAKNVTFVHADAKSFIEGQPARSYDAIVSAFTIHNMPAKYRRELFKEMGRVLKPGGVIVTGDRIMPDDMIEYWKLFKAEVNALRVFSKQGRPDLERDWIEHMLDDEATRLTESEQAELFKIAGCGEVVIHHRWRAALVMSAVRV